MARRRRTRSRSRSKFRKYRKMRKLWRRSRKISKKRISGRRRIPGNSMRIKTKTETKFTHISSQGVVALRQITTVNPSASIIAVTDGAIANVQGLVMMPLPTQGVGVGQIIGNKWIYKMLDCRFSITPGDVNLTTAKNILVRIMVVTERMQTSDVDVNLFVNYTAGFCTNFHVPINTRFFKIHLDKTFNLMTGITPASAAGTFAQYNQTIVSPAKHFKFIIPFKQMGNLLVANWRPEKRTYIIGMTDVINGATLSNTNLRAYFIDP